MRQPGGCERLLVGFEEALELTDARGMAHLAQGLGLDLPDALAGDFELAADFFEGAAVAVDEAEALLEDLALALGEGVEDVADFFLQQGDGGDVARILRGGIRDEIAEGGVVALTDGRLKGDGLL